MKNNKKIALLGLLLLLGACVKVRPSAYQNSLQNYYRGLLGGTTEASLQQAIAGVSKDLEKAAADPNLLMLRTSARLELLRLGIDGNQAFNVVRAKEFFDDLRLLQTLVEKPGNVAQWLSPRVHIMYGDALLLKSQEKAPAAAQAEEDEKVRRSRNIRDHIVRMQLFRLAADAYLRAAALTAAGSAAVKGNKDLEANLPAFTQESEHAKDGYINALSGMAQSENFLRLTDDARRHLLEARDLTSGAAFPPKDAAPSGPSSLFAYAHDLAAKQSRALETLTPNDFPARLAFAQTALREEIAARMLSNPVQPVSANTLPGADAISIYLAGATAQATSIKLTGAGDLPTETIDFLLRAEPLYSSAGILADVPNLTLNVGTEKIPLRFVPAVSSTIQNFFVNPGGVKVSVQSKAGTTAVSAETGATFFLGRTAALLAKDKPISFSGPLNLAAGTAP